MVDADAFIVLRRTLVAFNERKQEFFCRVCHYHDPLGPDGSKLHDDHCPLLAAIEEHERLLAQLAAKDIALRKAIETIRAWHAMGLDTEEAAVWELYQQSPEMQQINAALADREKA